MDEIKNLQSDEEDTSPVLKGKQKRTASAKRIIISGKPPVKSPEKKGLEATSKLNLPLTIIVDMSK